MIGKSLFHVKILMFELQKRESLEVLVIVNIYFRFNLGGGDKFEFNKIPPNGFPSCRKL